MAKRFSIEKEIAKYKEDGFVGFVPVSMLRGNTAIIPKEGGVYVVIRNSDSAPQFLETGTGGFHKGENPNVPIATLIENYVEDSHTVYIGMSIHLRTRIKELLRFGAGKGGHKGGKYLWQLADSGNLLVAWKTTPGCDPRAIETQMIRDFAAVHGKRPFANLKY